MLFCVRTIICTNIKANVPPPSVAHGGEDFNKSSCRHLAFIAEIFSFIWAIVEGLAGVWLGSGCHTCGAAGAAGVGLILPH